MRISVRGLSQGFWFAIVFAIGPRVLAQQGGEVTGNAPQRAGMAGAGAAGATSGLDLVNNPAALGFLPRRNRNRTTRVEMVGRLALNPLEIQTADGTLYEPHRTTAGGPFLSWTTGAGNEWSWGIALVPTAGGGASYRRTVDLNVATAPGGPPYIPRQAEIPIDVQVIQLGLEPALAWRPSKKFSVGLGASIRYTRLDLISAADIPFTDLKGPGVIPGQTMGEFFQFLMDSNDRGDVTSMQAGVDATADALPHVAFKLSFLWEPRLGRRLTGWVRSPTNAQDLEGTIVVDLADDMGEILDLYGFDTVGNFRLRVPGVRFPAQVGLAWMEFVGRSDRFFLDAAWTNWSNSFDSWIASVDEGDGDLGQMTGDFPIEVDLGIEWRDNIKVSVGWEHDLFQPLRSGGTLRASGSPWTLRGGVGWASNPVGGAPLPGLLPVQPLHFALGATRWGKLGSGDWHFAGVVAPPASYVSGVNPQLSDLSGDTYRQTSISLAVGWTVSF